MRQNIFFSPLIPKSLWETIGSIGWGHNFIFLPIFSYVLLIVVIVAIMAYEPVIKPLQQGKIRKLFVLAVIGATIGLALTMLYVQWSAYQSPIIDGFQGRYLYPLFPIFAIFIAPIPEQASEKRSIFLLWLFGIISSASLLWTTVSFYYL